MSSFPVLNDEEWLKLLEHVAKTYNEVTLSRGFTYFKQQRIASLSLSEGRVIQARVTGSEDYTVTLYVDKLQNSSCTCPVHRSCKHQAAVMMELADRLGYPAAQIVNAKHHIKRSLSASPSNKRLLELPSADISGWHQFLNDFTAVIKPAYDQGIYSEMLRHHLLSLGKSPIPFSEQDRTFFELHQKLFILRKLKEQHEQSGISFYTPVAVYKIYDEIREEIKDKSAAIVSGLPSERLMQTFHYVRQQMAEETGRRYLHLGLYTTLWKYWAAPHSEFPLWIAQETDALEKQYAESASFSLSAAKAFLFLLQKRSSEAWEALEHSGALKEAPVELLLPFLDQLRAADHWEGLVDWLKKSASFFSNNKTRELDVYMSYWREAIERLPQADEEMWSVLEQLLPHSLHVIEDMLYEQRKWKPWLEMQILQGHDPLYHRVSVLQPIEKDSPQLLLPYYHQAVDHYVRLKNRHDYKAAVKLLKRLEKIYKKMKLNERWERFFSFFLERHSRLRALQEELKKGKLLQ